MTTTEPLPTLGHVERCSGCAFRAGTDANRSLSRLHATICAHAGEAFFCHQAARDGEVCVGWLELANALAAKGQFPEPVPWRRAVYAAMLEAIGQYIERPELGEQRAIDALWEALDRLSAHGGSDGD